jgi:hypothetical protein
VVQVDLLSRRDLAGRAGPLAPVNRDHPLGPSDLAAPAVLAPLELLPVLAVQIFVRSQQR